MKLAFIGGGLALALALVSLFASLDISRAASATNVPDVECYPWATTEDWTITRCQDWSNGEACLIASSGFVACRFD